MSQICQTAETWKVAGCNAEVRIGSCGCGGEAGSWRDVFERIVAGNNNRMYVGEGYELTHLWKRAVVDPSTN